MSYRNGMYQNGATEHADKVKEAVKYMSLDLSEIPVADIPTLVKEKYRILCKEWHPDTCTYLEKEEAEERMKNLSFHHETLLSEISGYQCKTLVELQEKVKKNDFSLLGTEYDTDLFVPKTKPYLHQVAAFNRFRDFSHFALFMDMGTGKTKTIIDIATHKFVKGDIDTLLVIAPNHVHTQWAKEQFPQHCSIPYNMFVWEQKNWTSQSYKLKLQEFMLAKSPTLKVICMNVEAFSASTGDFVAALLIQNNEVFAVLDESTRIKNPKAVRTKKILANVANAKCRAILTGTPTAKSPLDIYAPFNFLQEDYFGMSYAYFSQRFSITSRERGSKSRRRKLTQYDFRRVKECIARWWELKAQDNDVARWTSYDCYCDVSEFVGMYVRDVRYIDNLDRFSSSYRDQDDLRDIISPVTIAVNKEDCLDLPEKIYEIVPVDMIPEQQKAYKDLAAWMAATYYQTDENGENISEAQLEVKGILALLIRFSQITGGFFPNKTFEEDSTTLVPFSKNAKLNAMLDHMQENCHDKQAIVWCNFNSEVDAIVERLEKEGFTCATYQGRDSNEQREENLDLFKKGAVQILVSKTTVAGYGLNLQFCSYQYYFSNNFRTEARLQAEDRTHRIGQKSTCVYVDIVCRNSIDQVVLSVLRSGKELNDYFKDIDFADVVDGIYVDPAEKAKEDVAAHKKFRLAQKELQIA